MTTDNEAIRVLQALHANRYNHTEEEWQQDINTMRAALSAVAAQDRLVDGQGHIDPRSPLDPTSNDPRWDFECEVCGATPVHPLTGMCGPCTFGEAETIGGNWQ